MQNGKEVTLTCTAGDETATVKVIGYTTKVTAAQYDDVTVPDNTTEKAAPNKAVKTEGATYSYKVTTDAGLSAAELAKIKITIDPATGDLKVKDTGYAESNAKTVVVTVTASKDGFAPATATVNIKTKRA